MFFKHHNQHTWLIALVIVISVIFLAACAGQATPAMPTTDTVESKPTDTAVAAATPTEAVVEPTATEAAPIGDVGFAADVQPIFNTSCKSCHGPDKVNRGLLLDSYENVMLGGENGPVVVAGDPEGSKLIQLIEQGKMPKRGEKLSAQELAILKAWIQAGAQNN